MGLRQIISTSSKHKKHKYEDTPGRHLRFFITTHPTSCLHLHRETHALRTGREMQNKHSVNKEWLPQATPDTERHGIHSVYTHCMEYQEGQCHRLPASSDTQQWAPEKVQSQIRAAFTLTVYKLKEEKENLVQLHRLQRAAHKLMPQLHPPTA